MEYRGIKYRYKTWTTWDNQEASCFGCSDKNLLQNVSTTSFETKTLEELHDTIDYYLDNVDKCKKSTQLNHKATEELNKNNPNTPKD